MLHIDRPVLIGHSIAGEELSSVGSRFPEKVSGLIYLDAATDFAFYDPAHPIVEVEMNDIRRRIDEIEAGGIDRRRSYWNWRLLSESSRSFFIRTILAWRICLRCHPARRSTPR